MADTSPPPPRGGPWLPITSEATLRACSAFQAKDVDVFVCSYPKSGTTLCQNIVAQILTRGVNNKSDDDSTNTFPFQHVSQVSPFFEIDAHWDHGSEKASTSGSAQLSESVIENHSNLLRGRRAFNTHLPYEMMPFVWDTQSEKTTSRRPKIIYISRDGRDAAVSFWHHLKSQCLEDGGLENKDFNNFFDEWLNGEIVFGSWFDHLVGWEQAREEPNALMITYEEAVSDLKTVVAKIAEHIDFENPLTGAELTQITKKCSFDAMKKDLNRYQPISVTWTDPDFSFIRKGKIGGYKDTFTEEQLERFETETRKKFGEKV